MDDFLLDLAPEVLHFLLDTFLLRLVPPGRFHTSECMAPCLSR